MSMRLGIVAAIALGLSTTWPVRAGTDWDLAHTQVLIVGVLKWKDPAITRFSPRHRKDKELAETLIRKGVPKDNVTVLLDEQATLQQICTALEATAARAKPQDTMLFYYCGHGRGEGDVRVFLCNYDAGGPAHKPDFGSDEITATLKKHFRGARVILLADCCYSGGLQETARQLSAAGIPAASLTSADARSSSTSSWIFTQTLLDGLNGDPLLDANGDGAITLEELAGEVRLAMKCREGQPAGVALHGLPPSFRLFPTDRGSALPGPLKGPFALKDYVRAPDGTRLRPARVVGQEGDQYRVEFYDYSDKRRALVPAARLAAISFPTFGAGEVVHVAHAEGVFPAKVLRAENDCYLVHYVGWPESMNEWVAFSHVVGTLRAGPTPAMVEWHKTWWPAVVLRAEKDRYRIHYVAHDDTWDEWVGPERIRFQKAAQVEWAGRWWSAVIRKTAGEKFFIHYVNHADLSDEWVGPDRIRLDGK